MGKILSRLGEDLTPDVEVEGPGLRSGNGSWAGEGQKEQKGAGGKKKRGELRRKMKFPLH